MYCFIVIASGLVVAAAAPTQDGNLTHQFKDGARAVQAFNLGPSLEASLQEFFDGLAENGYDPFEPVDQQVIDYSLPDGSLKVHGVFDGIRVTGLSGGVVNVETLPEEQMNVEFIVAFPELNISASRALVDIEYLDESYQLEGSGWIVFQNVTVLARADLSNPLSVNVASVGVTIGGVQSHFTGIINGVNYTDNLNELINLFLLPFLTENNSETNNALNELLIEFLNYIFSLL